jgi:hypothetical protein
MKTGCIMLCLLFNTDKKIKTTDIEREFQNVPYFLRAANADFRVNLLLKNILPPVKIKKSSVLILFRDI